ncbi:antitoxin [Streptomyces sp. t39]|uniref:antitoxin n=1 Tax=Streptomyces sp. t39 TaxID=1828156 RepID=UPI0011CD4AFE|nr:antitoxin [Streptomyces sp. t39]TXS57242.1 antitoxin [Streptomyces sp. t39]
MGTPDTVKAELAPAGEKVACLSRQRVDGTGHGPDTAARSVGHRTGGRYRSRIDTGTGGADAPGRITHREDDGTPRPPAT